MADAETNASSVYEGESVPTYGQTSSTGEGAAAENNAPGPDLGAVGSDETAPKAKWRYHNLDSALLEFLAFLAECSVPVVRIQDLTFGDSSFGGGQSMRVIDGKLDGRSVAIKLFKEDSFKPGYTVKDAKAMEDEAAAFQQSLRDMMFEIRIMCHPQLKTHPNIAKLYAVAFQDGLVAPNVKDSATTSSSSTSASETAVAGAAAPRSQGMMRQEIFYPVLVLEPASTTYPDLTRFLKAHAEKGIPQGLVSSLICDIAMGLSALHRLGITHGDVKDDNILIFESGEGAHGRFVAKVSDFGAAGIDPARENTRAQSRYWAAPEALERPSGWEGLRLTPEADVYSFGILAATIAMPGGRMVFDGKEAYAVKMDDTAAKIITAQLDLLEDLDVPFKDALKGVLNRTVVLDRKKRLRDLSSVPELLEATRRVVASSDQVVPFHSYGTLAHPGIPPLASKVADTIYNKLPLSIKRRFADLAVLNEFVDSSRDSQTMLVHLAQKMKEDSSSFPEASDDLVRSLLGVRLSSGNTDGEDGAAVPLEVDEGSAGGFMQMYIREFLLGRSEEPRALLAVRENDRDGLLDEISRDPRSRAATMGNGWTGLHYCAFFDRPDLMDCFLDGPDAVRVDAAAESAPAYTPLHVAAQRGNHECARRLIDHKADVEARLMPAGDFRMTPLQLTVLGVATQKLPSGDNNDDGGGDDDDLLKTIRILLDSGASVDFRYRGLGVAHQLAQERGGVKALSLFLDHDPALLCQLSPNRQTPLHSAAGSRNLPAVSLLLSRGADVHARNQAGDTPLHNAYMSIGPATRAGSRRYSAEFVQMLAGDEADAEEVIRLLVQAGSDEDAVGLVGIPWDTPEFRRYDEYEDASEFLFAPWEQRSLDPQVERSNQWSFSDEGTNTEGAEPTKHAIFERGEDKLSLDFELPNTTPNYYEVHIRLACLDQAIQNASITILVYQEKGDTALVLMSARLPLHVLDVNRLFTIKLRDLVVKHTTDLKMRVYEEATPGREEAGSRRGRLLLDWIIVTKFNIMTVVGHSTSAPISQGDFSP